MLFRRGSVQCRAPGSSKRLLAGPVQSAAPRLRASRACCFKASADQHPSSSCSSSNHDRYSNVARDVSGASTSSLYSGGADSGRQQQQRQQHPLARHRVDHFYSILRPSLASLKSSAAFALPGIGLAVSTAGNGGGPGGKAGSGGGGGGGGPEPGPAQQLYSLATAEDGEEAADKVESKEEEKEEPKDGWQQLVTDTEDLEPAANGRRGTNRCVEIVIEGWPDVGILPSKEELQDTLSVQVGHIFDYQDIVDDRQRLQLQHDDCIAGVEVTAEYVDDVSNHQRVTYRFKPHSFRGIDKIEIKGATLMPAADMAAICESCLPTDSYMVDVSLVDKVRSKVEKWYQDRGLPFCYVGFIDGMDEGTLRVNVTEAKVHDVKVKYVKHKISGDSEDEIEIYNDGKIVPADRIIQAAGFKRGDHYQVEDGYDAINNVFACGLLDDVHIEPEQDPTDVNKIILKIRVEEVQPKSMSMDLDWSFQLKGGVPQLSRQALIPGGSVDITHENLFGDGQSATLSLSASDWRNPSADLGFTLAYTEPFYAPNTTRNLQIFNTRKVSTVFTPGGEPDVPPVFVDRLGAKAWTSHVGGEDNKVESALMLQQIATYDENGQPLSKGTKVQRGAYADNGPPTTLSEGGRDFSLSYQGYCALDNVVFVNGNQLGRRAIFQVDQGLNPRFPLWPGKKPIGLTGGLYNKWSASYTSFKQLPFLPQLKPADVWGPERRSPNTVALHVKAGNCIGDMPPYDYFSLGGPYSVRGYNHGEIGAARRFLEGVVEVRVPLAPLKLPGQAYAFVDFATDLGSSALLAGNPSEYYRKPGRGMSYGVGLKVLGAARVEYARDCNAGTGSVLVNFGERL